MSSGWELPSRGSCDSAEGPVSRILSCAVIPLGAASPRTLISDLPGGFGNCLNRLAASGRCAAPLGSFAVLPSLFGLAPCGVYPAPGVTAGAVRSYRTFSPLPRRWTSATAGSPGKPGPLGYCVSRVALDRFRRNGEGVAEAVCFLWHWPSTSLQARVPDVIRHTALRSSDFPPPAVPVSRASGSDRPVLLPALVYREMELTPKTDEHGQSLGFDIKGRK